MGGSHEMHPSGINTNRAHLGEEIGRGGSKDEDVEEGTSHAVRQEPHPTRHSPHQDSAFHPAGANYLPDLRRSTTRNNAKDRLDAFGQEFTKTLLFLYRFRVFLNPSIPCPPDIPDIPMGIHKPNRRLTAPVFPRFSVQTVFVFNPGKGEAQDGLPPCPLSPVNIGHGATSEGGMRNAMGPRSR
jgi:hypothetical protein